MDILFYVIFPLATILIAIVLQRILKSPTLVALLVFAIFLIVAFTAYTSDFLINAIIYAILAFITASITKLIFCFKNKIKCACSERDLDEDLDGLQNSINSLENNIEKLTDLLSEFINDNTEECSCETLQKSIGGLEDNIDNLTDIITNALNGNNCGCNTRKMLRR